MRGESAIESMCTHAYVARMPCCDGVVMLAVDDQSASLGRELAKLVARGRRLERVTIEEARKLGAKLFSCECVPTPAETKIRRTDARTMSAAFERRRKRR